LAVFRLITSSYFTGPFNGQGGWLFAVALNLARFTHVARLTAVPNATVPN